MAQLAEQAGLPPIENVIICVVTHSGVTSAIVGPCTTEQPESYLPASHIAMSTELLARTHWGGGDFRPRDRPPRAWTKVGERVTILGWTRGMSSNRSMWSVAAMSAASRSTFSAWAGRRGSVGRRTATATGLAGIARRRATATTGGFQRTSALRCVERTTSQWTPPQVVGPPGCLRTGSGPNTRIRPVAMRSGGTGLRWQGRARCGSVRHSFPRGLSRSSCSEQRRRRRAGLALSLCCPTAGLGTGIGGGSRTIGRS